MKKLTSLVAGSIAAALLVASGSPSCAATTVYVSSAGSDASPCTVTAPCRHVAIALTAGGTGSAVSCLDAGPYFENFITSLSFTLDCRGVIYVGGGASNFSFSLQASAQVVTFRHVIFDGVFGGGGAVQIVGGGKVVFEDCTLQNFTGGPGEGIQFAPTAAGSHLTITDSIVANNGIPGGGGGGGIFILPSGGVTAGAVIERTQVTGNSTGIFALGTDGPALVEVRYSAIANSVLDGINAGTAGQTSSIVVEHSASVHNGGNGVIAQGPGAYVSLRDSTVDWNATGLSATGGGLILSYKDNMIAGNLSPGVTPLSLSQQ
jgi:hypothetical protein